MRPSDRARELGCSTLKDVITATGQSEQTLINWYAKRPLVFDACCLYAAGKLKENQSHEKN